MEALIERLRGKLAKKVSEAGWQSFIENPFVLRLAFGHPVLILGETKSQLEVASSPAREKKISDFAVKAAASGNLAIIEIKTAETILVETKEYRGGVQAPGRGRLSGAVNQLLDQRYQLQKEHTIAKGEFRDMGRGDLCHPGASHRGDAANRQNVAEIV